MGFNAPVNRYRVGLRLPDTQRGMTGRGRRSDAGIREAKIGLLPILDSAEPFRCWLSGPEQDLRMGR
jgi:hypothetical protein